MMSAVNEIEHVDNRVILPVTLILVRFRDSFDTIQEFLWGMINCRFPAFVSAPRLHD